MPTVLTAAGLVGAYLALLRSARIKARREAAERARLARRSRRSTGLVVRSIAEPDLRLLVTVPAVADLEAVL